MIKNMKIYLNRIISVFNSPPPTGWPCSKTSTPRFDVTWWNISQSKYYYFKLSRLYFPASTKISNGFPPLKPLDCPAILMSLTWSKTFKNWWTVSGIELTSEWIEEVHYYVQSVMKKHAVPLIMLLNQILSTTLW